VARSNELLEALASAQAGGKLAQTPGVEIAGITTGPGGRTWDAVIAADCPGLPGETVTFVVLEDKTIVVSTDLADGLLDPLAGALEEIVAPPYRAAAVRTEDTLWTSVAESVQLVPLPGVVGDDIELSIVDGQRQLAVDGEAATVPVEALDALAAEHGDVALSAERVDGEYFAVDVFPL
jgi:hypothetical protein